MAVQKQQLAATIVDDIDTEEAQATPGAIQYAVDGRGLFYICPCGCGQEGYLAFRGKQKVAAGKREWKGPTWEFNNNKELPTLKPSVHHRSYVAGEYKTHWHGWLKNGIWLWC